LLTSKSLLQDNALEFC